jgi:hypothetical protein
MKRTINPMLTKLRLSGMSESLEVRLHEAALSRWFRTGIRLSFLRFFRQALLF